MSNIFQIQQEYLYLITEIEENEGMLTPEIEESLLSNEADFNNKVENYVKIIHHWEGEVDTIKKEIERLTKLKKTKEASIESLENNLSAALKQRGIGKLNVGTNTLSFRKSESVVVLNPEAVPSEFIKEVTTETIDKNALKAWLKQGNTTDSAFIEVKQNLQIK
jgi:hypothetical protein